MKGGLIGCGYISRAQLQAWSEIDSAEIVAVCDLDIQKANERAQEFGIPRVYSDLNKMLDDGGLDFIDIATRPATHLQLVRSAVQHSLPVLCQKPLADTMSEAEDIVRMCKQAEVPLMVNENGRHQAWFRKIKELLEAGRLGVPQYARFESRWRASLPVPDFEGQDYFIDMPLLYVFEMGVHSLDTARFLFGEADTIYAQTKRVSPHIKGEDTALVIANFGPLTWLMDGNFFSYTEPLEHITWGPVRVEGTEGTVILEDNGSLILYGEQEPERWLFPQDTIAQSFAATQGHFIDCLQSGERFETSGEETLKTMALVFAAYKSSETGRPVQIVTPDQNVAFVQDS